MNNKLRQKVTNNFEKDFFKLMNNSVFGKIMENVKNTKISNLKNRKKKELFGPTTKLSFHKVFL